MHFSDIKQKNNQTKPGTDFACLGGKEVTKCILILLKCSRHHDYNGTMCETKHRGEAGLQTRALLRCDKSELLPLDVLVVEQHL